MPLLFTREVSPTCKIALWNITESAEELLVQLKCKVDPVVLQVHDQLKKQRICARLLVNQLSNQPCNELTYDLYSKPALANSSSKISISHAHEHVAIIVNQTKETGIDIELIKPKVEKIAHRFMSAEELLSVDNTKRTEQLITYWCAKEALYKYYGKKELHFKENILIDPFIQHDSGKIFGRIKTVLINTQLQLCYEKTGDYMLVYIND